MSDLLNSQILANKTVIFDMDGTLVDSAPDLVRAANEVMDKLSLPHVDINEMRKIVGRGARISMKRAANFAGYDISDNELDEYTPFFLKTYQKGITNKSKLYDGVPECLDILLHYGATLAVCTNKPTHLAELVLNNFGIIDKFKGIYGPESTPKTKPDAAHIYAAINGVAGNPDTAIMIGDSENDVLAARAAKIPVIVTSFGYTETKPKDLHADAIFDQYSQLPDLILKYIK